MARRWISLAVGIAAVLLLTAGAGLAGDRGAGVGGGGSGPAVVAACDGMHRSQGMRDLHAGMPREVRARCERMHADADRMHGGMGPMMDGSTMMGSAGGPGMMGSSGGGRMCGHRAAGPEAG